MPLSISRRRLNKVKLNAANRGGGALTDCDYDDDKRINVASHRPHIHRP